MNKLKKCCPSVQRSNEKPNCEGTRGERSEVGVGESTYNQTRNTLGPEIQQQARLRGRANQEGKMVVDQFLLKISGPGGNPITHIGSKIWMFERLSYCQPFLRVKGLDGAKRN